MLARAVGAALLRAAARVGLLPRGEDGDDDESDDDDDKTSLLPRQQAIELLKSIPPSEKLVRAALKLPASGGGEELALALLGAWAGTGTTPASAAKRGSKGSADDGSAAARALAAAAIKASSSSSSRRGGAFPSKKAGGKLVSIGEAWGV